MDEPWVFAFVWAVCTFPKSSQDVVPAPVLKDIRKKTHTHTQSGNTDVWKEKYVAERTKNKKKIYAPWMKRKIGTKCKFV